MPVKVLPNQTTGVRLSKYFAQTTEVTKSFYYSVMKDNPNGFVVTQPLDSEKNKPVECGFLEAVLFCNRLSKQCGLQPVYGLICKVFINKSTYYAYCFQTDPDVWDFSFTKSYKSYLYIDKTASGFRMPTDAEYLYAMGSGYDAVMSGNTVDHYVWKDSNNVSHNISDIGWTSETNVLEPQNVAQKIPNEYGLYDLSGNVSEWVSDGGAYFTNNSGYQSFTDNSVNYSSSSSSAPSSTYMASYAKNGYYSAPAALYNQLGTTYSTSGSRIDDGGSYLKDESYAVPYSDTKYPTNNKTRNSDGSSAVDLIDNGDGTYSCGSYKHGFRIVKQTPPYLLDKWNGDYKFIMPGSASFEPIPLKKIIAGYFYQGAQATDITMPNYDINAQADESPVHKVLLTSDFYIGIEKIPVNLWLTVMGLNNNYLNNVTSASPSRLANTTSYNYYNSGIITNDANFCMYNMLHSRAKITWRKALIFCNRLSRMLGLEPVYHFNGNYNEDEWIFTTSGTGAYADFVIGQNAYMANDVQVDKSKHGFRLPSESEFEYVCKGGILKDTFLYPGSNDPIETGTHITTSTKGSNQQFYNFKPNSLGIYDLASVVTETLQDSTNSSSTVLSYSDSSYPQPRTGEDFVINPIVECVGWTQVNQRYYVGRGINTSAAYSYFNDVVGRNTYRKMTYGSTSYAGEYKYTNTRSENFRLVLQSPEVLPENMTPTSYFKETKSINVILDYKQEPTNCVNNTYINDSRGYDHYNIRNYQLLPDKLSFNTIQVPIGSYSGSTTSTRNKNVKIVYENQFMNYDNTLNSGTEYNNMQYYKNTNNYYIEVMEVPLTIEMYRALYPNCSELEYNNNYYADSNNDPSCYRQYYGISWYKALEIANLLTQKLRYTSSYNYPIQINSSIYSSSWGTMPTDEASAIADYTNYSGSGGCWNDPVIVRGSRVQNNFYYVYEPLSGRQRTGWRLPTCLEMLYIAFGGDSRYNDTQLYPGSNEISDVSCFKIVDNSGNEVTDYTQVTNLTDYHLESKNGLTYAEGYSKNKMYKPNCFNIYDLATNCCLCYDFLESTDNPGTDGTYIAPLKLSNGTSGYRRCCVFGVPSGVDHATDTNSLAHYSMRLFTEVKPWESYPFQSLRLVRTLYGYEF